MIRKRGIKKLHKSVESRKGEKLNKNGRYGENKSKYTNDHNQFKLAKLPISF